MDVNVLINIILVVVVLVLGYILMTYNSLIKMENTVEQSLSDIDTLLKQRFDMIPNLVETIKGYAKHEKTTFTEVTELRSSYEKTKSSADANALDSGINKLLAVAENYPELKANQNFLMLQKELNEIEENLQYYRSRYNRTVTAFNNKVETVPSDVIANLFGFKKKDLYKIEESERENQNIKL